MFTGSYSCGSEVLVYVDDRGGEDGKKHAEAQNNQVSDAYIQSRFPTKEGLSALVLVEGGRERSHVDAIDGSRLQRHGDDASLFESGCCLGVYLFSGPIQEK